MKKVLIVEDDLMLADIIEEILTQIGFVVCGIARGIGDAFALAEQHKPELAIVDVHLNDGIGIDIAPVLIERYHTGILYTTANIDAISNAVGHACLHKPFRLSQIKEALDVVVESVDAGSLRPKPYLIPDRRSLTNRCG